MLHGSTSCKALTQLLCLQKKWVGLWLKAGLKDSVTPCVQTYHSHFSLGIDILIYQENLSEEEFSQTSKFSARKPS